MFFEIPDNCVFVAGGGHGGYKNAVARHFPISLIAHIKEALRINKFYILISHCNNAE